MIGGLVLMFFPTFNHRTGRKGHFLKKTLFDYEFISCHFFKKENSVFEYSAGSASG